MGSKTQLVFNRRDTFIVTAWMTERVSVDASKFLGSIAGCLVSALLDSIFYKMEETNHW